MTLKFWDKPISYRNYSIVAQGRYGCSGVLWQLIDKNLLIVTSKGLVVLS